LHQPAFAKAGMTPGGTSYLAGVGLERPTSENHVVDHKHDDGADDGDQQAINIEAGYANGSKGVEQETTYDSAHYAEYDVKNETFPCPVDNFAADKASDQS
jgi:hypothetical protein